MSKSSTPSTAVPWPSRLPSTLLWLLLAAFTGGCDSTPEARALPDAALDASADGAAGDGDPVVDGPRGDIPRLPLAPLRAVVEGRFGTSKQCESCHANVQGAQAMRDAKGRPVAPLDLWRATAMANAARDPFWRAAVAAEVAAMPQHKAEIEATCLRCHSPMAHTEASKNGETPITMALLSKDTPRAQLALDGVSCTLCHQIADTKLGDPASYSGGFSIGDDKLIYGPHSGLFSSPMIGASGGFDARTSPHVLKSGVCASCHTLFVDSFDAKGQKTGTRFPEQTPYLEWLNSAYTTEGASPGPQAQSCQGCHMPTSDADGAPISAQVATDISGSDYSELVVPKRSPYGRHLFVGGNTLLPSWLRDFADELAPTASAAAFDALIARARDQLRERTATLTIDSAQRSGDSLDVRVTVRSQAGHKLPTGYPARRVVLQLRVETAAGSALFVSGAFDARGRLIRADGSLQLSESAGGPQQAHHQTISSADQVQIYEAVLADTTGKATYHLLQAATYLKDNRLLPSGWDPAFAGIADIAPAGVTGDADFVAGGDTVRYQVALPAGQSGPLTVKATLYYQPLSPRHAAELLLTRVPEVLVLERMLATSGYMPEQVAEASQGVP
jgi:hypothetical protein